MSKKRYRLIRDCCFDERLPDYFNAPCLEVKNRNLIYPKQLSLSGVEFDEFDKRESLNVRLGRFFEILANGIYGGKIGNFYEFSKLNGENIRSGPDIIHQKINIIREVKATHIRNNLQLRDKQMEDYFSWQLGSYSPKSPLEVYPSKPPTIRFEIFRHNVKGLYNIFNENGLEGMISKLAEETKAMISLPFSIMYRIHKAGIPFTGRCKGETFGNSTRFYASGLNSLLAEPKKTLKKLKIDLGFFKLEKRKFPNNVKINEKLIAPFPVLIIIEKEPEKLRFLKKTISEEDIPF